MRGSITERRPGIWRLTVSAGFDDAGSRQRVTRTVKGGRRTAERELTTMLKDLDAGTLADGRQRLDRYLTEEWLPAVSALSKRGRALAPTTRQRYRDACRHVSEIIGKVRLDELRPAHVEKVRDALLARDLAPQTVSDVLRVLSQALSRAEARGLVGRNPAAPELVHRPIAERGSFTVIDAELGGKIIREASGTDPWDAAVHLALGLGLRREEVLGLRWEDVDEAVHVRRTLTAADGAFHFGPPKSAAGRRDLPLPGFVARAIHRHRLDQSERLFALGIRPELVVCNPIGEPFQPATFSGMWKDWADVHGFAGITFHGLRHGAATLLLAAGVSDTVAMRTMGHADTRILARYQDVVSELQRDAATRMDQLLGGA
ncbi:MAG: site-specific integrase [Actinomycetota bacterium]|nr:site-specific integrase [Actinomycetota bacterium]